MFRRRIPDISRLERQNWTPRDLFDFFDTLWNQALSQGFFNKGNWDLPAVNVGEDEKNINVKAELPGMEAKDVDISLQNNNLILQGEKKFEDEQNRHNYYKVERSYGQFYRTVPLSTEVEESNVKAKMNNGVLEITLPKKEPASGTKKIEIES